MQGLAALQSPRISARGSCRANVWTLKILSRRFGSLLYALNVFAVVADYSQNVTVTKMPPIENGRGGAVQHVTLVFAAISIRSDLKIQRGRPRIAFLDFFISMQTILVSSRIISAPDRVEFDAEVRTECPKTSQTLRRELGASPQQFPPSRSRHQAHVGPWPGARSPARKPFRFQHLDA